jgi:hypothetical protein
LSFCPNLRTRSHSSEGRRDTRNHLPSRSATGQYAVIISFAGHLSSEPSCKSCPHNNMDLKYDQGHIFMESKTSPGDTSRAQNEEEPCPTPQATATV